MKRAVEVLQLRPWREVLQRIETKSGVSISIQDGIIGIADRTHGLPRVAFYTLPNDGSVIVRLVEITEEEVRE